MMDILAKVISAQNSLYSLCDFKINNLIVENESAEYYAHTFYLKSKHIKFRIAKKTPTKDGQFVAMWKRMADNKIRPYDKSDQIDLFIINILYKNNIGQFIFPQSILLEKNIFSINNNGGKRAIRIYSPWDYPNSKQATKTKNWQSEYFVDITSPNYVEIERIKKLYSA